MQHSENQSSSSPIKALEILERKSRLYGTLAMLWWLPTFGCLVILAMGLSQWSVAPTFTEALRQIRIEDWIALAILSTHLILALLFWKYRRLLETVRSEKRSAKS